MRTPWKPLALVVPALLLQCLLAACEHATAEPSATVDSRVSGTAKKTSPPILKAALRTGTACVQGAECTSYNIVSVSDQTDGTLVTVDPSVGDLFTATILVTPDTAWAVPMVTVSGLSPSSQLYVRLRDPQTGAPSTYQSFSMVIF